MPQDLSEVLRVRLSSNHSTYAYKLREKRPWLRYWTQRRALIRQFIELTAEHGIKPETIKVLFGHRTFGHQSKSLYGWSIAISTRHPRRKPDDKFDDIRGELIVTPKGRMKWIGNDHLRTPQLAWIQYQMLEFLVGQLRGRRGSTQRDAVPSAVTSPV